MTREQARALLGNQPKWALRNCAKALQMMTSLNTFEDWRRLEALRALGYKVTCFIPEGAREQAIGRKAMGAACAAEFTRRYPRVVIGKPGAAYAGEE